MHEELDAMPAALSVYDIPLPRERSLTFPSVDFHMWKARQKLLESTGDGASGGCSRSNSTVGSCETLPDMDCLPALCAYDIPLPACDQDYDLHPVVRQRSMTLPASDLGKYRLKKLMKYSDHDIVRN